MSLSRIILFVLALEACNRDSVFAFSSNNAFHRANNAIQIQIQSTKSRTRPLFAFEVMAGVEAVEVASQSFAVSQASASTMTAVNTFFQTQPYLAAFLTCSVKASAADMLAQSQEEPQEEPVQAQPIVLEPPSNPLDVSRNLGFLLYGGLYSGMAQNYLYHVVYPALLGTDDSMALIIKQVLADNLISAPLLCLPIAYIFKTAFTSNEELSLDTLKQGLEKYVEDVTTKGLLTKYWTLWVPVQCLTFGVVPLDFRVVFVAAVSFFWIFILSTIASSETDEKNLTVPSE